MVGRRIYNLVLPAGFALRLDLRNCVVEHLGTHLDAIGELYQTQDKPEIKLTAMECIFKHSTFYNLNLSGSALTDCTFKHCDFSNADLSGVDFLFGIAVTNCEGLILSGERKGWGGPYQFLGVKNDVFGYMIKAGCRWFTPREATQHWANTYGEKDETSRQLVKNIEWQAELWGWLDDVAPEHRL